MRKTRRILLRLLGLLVLLVVVLGGLAAAGWLPPFTHWVEGRLLAELRVLGVETDATHLQELSWKRAVVGPVKLELPGLTLNAHEARAELGWAVLARRGAPHVVLDGLVLEADMRRLDELRGALQPKEGGFPYGRLEILNSRVVLRNGDRRLELPFTGFFDSSVEAFRSELVLDGEALAGRVSVRGDLIADSVEIDVTGADGGVSDWVAITSGIGSTAAEDMQFGEKARARVSGNGTLREGRWVAARCEAMLPGLVWQSGGHRLAVGPGSVALGLADGGPWRCEAKPEALYWNFGDRSAELARPRIVYEPGRLHASFADGRASAVGLEVAGGGEIDVGLPDSGMPPTGKATLRLSAAGARGWTLAETAEVNLGWNGAELSIAVPKLELAGERPLQLAGFEATAGGFAGGQPRLVAKADAGVDLNRWFAGEGARWRMEPGIVAGKVSVSAVLDPGAEGVRAEVAVPSRRRTLFADGERVEAVVGGEVVFNLDREYVSGRAALELHDVIARHGELSFLAPNGSVVVRWPRVWSRAVARWGRAAPERLLRDLLWTGDYEFSVKDGVVRDGSSRTASGIDGKWVSRGAEVFETGGVSVGVSVADLDWSGARLSDLQVAIDGGLDGGKLTASCAVEGLPIRPTLEQNLGWSDGFVMEGKWGFDPVVLTGKEQWDRWWPAFAGWELGGGIAVAGRNRLEAGRWELGADLVLQDLRFRARQRDMVLDGIKGRISLDSLMPLRTAPEQRLVCRSGRFGGVGFDNLSTTFAYSADTGLAVSSLEGMGLGGQLACSSFRLDPDHPEVATNLSFKRARVEDLLALFDDVPVEASGFVDGMIPLSWKGNRVGFGTGYLRLSEGEIGRVHFTRNLHLLTRDRRPGSPEYASLVQVEQSIQNLVFNRLQIDLYPKESAGQSMRVRMVGAPAGGEFAVPVSIDVNVNAPLEHFLNWGIAGGR